jgi:hypothetical protein
MFLAKAPSRKDAKEEKTVVLVIDQIKSDLFLSSLRLCERESVAQHGFRSQPLKLCTHIERGICHHAAASLAGGVGQ